jgi:hypothetical protein
MSAPIAIRSSRNGTGAEADAESGLLGCHRMTRYRNIISRELSGMITET